MTSIRRQFHDVGNKLNKIRLAANIIKERVQGGSAGGTQADIDKIIRDCDVIERSVLEADQGLIDLKEVIYRMCDPDKPAQELASVRQEGSTPVGIFILEDDEEICVMLKEAYERKGFCVRYCLNGESALKEISQGSFQIALLDIHLAGKVSGLDVLRAIRMDLPAIHCLVVTKDDDPQVHQQIMKAGAKRILLKPLTMKELDAQISGILAKV
jgi:CheY-like chemotaxis protein